MPDTVIDSLIIDKLEKNQSWFQQYHSYLTGSIPKLQLAMNMDTEERARMMAKLDHEIKHNRHLIDRLKEEIDPEDCQTFVRHHLYNPHRKAFPSNLSQDQVIEALVDIYLCRFELSFREFVPPRSKQDQQFQSQVIRPVLQTIYDLKMDSHCAASCLTVDDLRRAYLENLGSPNRIQSLGMCGDQPEEVILNLCVDAFETNMEEITKHNRESALKTLMGFPEVWKNVINILPNLSGIHKQWHKETVIFGFFSPKNTSKNPWPLVKSILQQAKKDRRRGCITTSAFVTSSRWGLFSLSKPSLSLSSISDQTSTEKSQPIVYTATMK